MFGVHMVGVPFCPCIVLELDISVEVLQLLPPRNLRCSVGRPLKMLPSGLLLLCLTVASAKAQAATTNEFYSTTFSTLTNPTTSDFTGSQFTYVSYTAQSTIDTSNGTETATGTDSQSTRTTTSQSLTLIGGSSPTSNGTTSSTSSSARATNTVPCNNYPEFCERKYSNITEVCSHNSFFVEPNNAGSNQALAVRDQLDDGVRMRE